jgi:hypothetical protein
MTPRLMERLGLLAAANENRLSDEIRRQTALAAQLAEQRILLANYRARLADSWRSGQVVHAGVAKRAGHFDAASEAAEVQIELLAVQAAKQLETVLQNLAEAKAYSQNLETARQKAVLQCEREAEQRRERAQPQSKTMLAREENL